MNRIYRLFVSLSALLGVAAFPVMAQDEEVNLNKTATYNYETHVGEITLESFVPGSVHYVYKPFDVVLVLDVSTSLSDTQFSDMKKGAISVVNQVLDFNTRAGAVGNSKLGIVTFGTDSYIKFDLQVINSQSAEDAKGIINGLTKSGTTYSHKGLDHAHTMLNTGGDAERIKFVIFFTDGKPGSSTYDDQSLTEGKNTIKSAYKLKSIGVKLFSIGLFKDDPSSKGFEWSYKFKVSIKDYLERVSSLYQGITEFTYTGSSSSSPTSNPYSITWKGNTTRDDSGIEYYRWAKQSSDLEDIFTDIIRGIVSGASKLEAHTTMKDFVNNNFFQYPDNADEDNITIKKQQCTNYDKTTKVFTFGPDMELTPEEKANVKIKLTRADKSNPNSRDLIEVYGYDYAANWCGMDESVTPAVPHGYKLVIKFPFIFKGGNEVSGALKTNTEDSGIYPVQTDEEGHPKTDPDGKPIPEDKPTKEYIPPTILFNTLTITRTNLDEGETAIYKVERNGEFVCNVALGGVKGKETEGVSKTIYGLPGDAGQKFRVTETNWNWAYHTGGVLPFEEKEVTTTIVIEDDKEIIKPDPLEFEFSGQHRTNKSDPDDPVNYHNHGESFVVNKLILP